MADEATAEASTDAGTEAPQESQAAAEAPAEGQAEAPASEEQATGSGSEDAVDTIKIDIIAVLEADFIDKFKHLEGEAKAIMAWLASKL